MKIYKIVLLGIIFLMHFAGYSQDKQAITLEDVLKIGGASNLTIKEYNELQNLALAESKQAKSWWLPEIYTGAKTHNLWGTAMNTDGRFFDGLATENFWAGLGLNVILDVGDHMFKAKASSLRLEASMHLTQSKRNEVLLKNIKLYYNSLQFQLEMIAHQELVKQSKNIVDQITIRVDAGLTYESDLLLAKSNNSYLQTKALEAKIAFVTSLSLLQEQLNIAPTTQLVCADTVLTTLALNVVETSLEDTYKKRPEVKYLELYEQSLVVEKKTYTTGLLIPSIQAGTNIGVFGKPVSPLANQGVLNFGLMWKIPLAELGFGGMNKIYQSKIALSQIKLEQTKNHINQEVIESKQTLILYTTILKLAEDAQTFSKKGLQQSLERQQLGTAKILEVFQMQQAYLKARLAYTNAVIRYNLTQYNLFVAMGNNL